MTLNVNANINVASMQQNIAKSSALAEESKADTNNTSVQNTSVGISDDVTDITENIDMYLELLRNKSRMNETAQYQESLAQNMNLINSKPNLRDASFASEAVKMVQNNIMQQGAVSILSHANQKTEIALSLLND